MSGHWECPSYPDFVPTQHLRTIQLLSSEYAYPRHSPPSWIDSKRQSWRIRNPPWLQRQGCVPMPPYRTFGVRRRVGVSCSAPHGIRCNRTSRGPSYRDNSSSDDANSRYSYIPSGTRDRIPMHTMDRTMGSRTGHSIRNTACPSSGPTMRNASTSGETTNKDQNKRLRARDLHRYNVHE